MSCTKTCTLGKLIGMPKTRCLRQGRISEMLCDYWGGGVKMLVPKCFLVHSASNTHIQDMENWLLRTYQIKARFLINLVQKDGPLHNSLIFSRDSSNPYIIEPRRFWVPNSTSIQRHISILGLQLQFLLHFNAGTLSALEKTERKKCWSPF